MTVWFRKNNTVTDNSFMTCWVIRLHGGPESTETRNGTVYPACSPSLWSSLKVAKIALFDDADMYFIDVRYHLFDLQRGSGDHHLGHVGSALDMIQK